MDKKGQQSSKNSQDINNLVERKLTFFQDVIQKTILNSQKNKILDILGVSDITTCVNTLNAISEKMREINNTTVSISTDSIVNKLQILNNELSGLLKNYGTDSFEDLLSICFGNNASIVINEEDTVKYELLKKYFHPTQYKVVNLKKSETDKIKTSFVDEFVTDKTRNLDCSDLAMNSKQFHLKVYGIKVYVYHSGFNKHLMVYGIVDDIMLGYLNNKYINKKLEVIKNIKPTGNEFKDECFEKYISALTLKDYLINCPQDIINRYVGNVTQSKLLKQKNLTQIVKDFILNDLYAKRSVLIQLLISSTEYDNKYMAYLLYDLLSNDSNGTVDTVEQTILFDSFPWSIKQYFREAMKKTIQYTNELSNFDVNKIPLEQQICLMKTEDSVKEKAMVKLKEVKAKSEDSGSKARQYLDGLLKIPFNIYTKEPIMFLMDENRKLILDVLRDNKIKKLTGVEELKEKYTSIEMLKYVKNIKDKMVETNAPDLIKTVKKQFNDYDKANLVLNIKKINDLIDYKSLSFQKIESSGVLKKELLVKVSEFIEYCKVSHKDILLELNTNIKPLSGVSYQIKSIESNFGKITDYMKTVKKTLDASVHGHDKAKKQIERIIGQWINGEQDGYCFGFEGPPGVGKCFAKNTPIMLSTGCIKMVQDITINDKLMGDDSFPRNVLVLGNGREKMYKIEQVKGDDYIVNESHILSLKMTKSGKKGDKHQIIMGKRYFKNDVIDICIKDYLGLPKYIKECLKGYKVGVDFVEKDLSIDPYILGYWLGDGSSRSFSITTVDQEIIDHFKDYANGYNLKCNKNKITYSFTTGIIGGRSDKNVLLNKMKEYNLINNKHIPQIYKCNSCENRLKLLAGLIDSDGYHNKENNALEIVQKNKKLAEDILWLVRSLGFRGMMKDSIKSCTYKGEKKTGLYYRITITGKGLEKIPTLLERKKARKHKQVKDPLNTGIKIIPLEEDDYYGFQIDGNSRFLLGDFTVTHNTSMAKTGLANCLLDENGNSRPFAMIQMGGDSNGSSLHGHNYTYVGSTWGGVVQILIDKKCMNPIILIDELDKISKTEHGREIVGILTHLLDPTQNDCFQDKYFSGIDLDLSKALFILSYNDVDSIDKILLDRIHRVKFSSLSLEDKLVIADTHLLPEVYKKMGLEGIINMSNDVIKFIVDEYTSEPGVRKFKEILFEIVGEINLDILKNQQTMLDYPIIITIEDVKTKYFKDKQEIKITKIPDSSSIGIINGLWANAMGRGGIIPIQARYYPCDKFLNLKLTGMQGDVMKESMNVALTLAWNLTSFENREKVRQLYEDKKHGIHIHCPEGSVPKDGPSAGTAITTVIYSLFNSQKIKHNVAITGEISLDGRCTEIGGLDLKFLGGIKAGVKEFLYPTENEKDYKSFMEKYENNDIIKDIVFHPVNNINEVFELVFEK